MAVPGRFLGRGPRVQAGIVGRVGVDHPQLAAVAGEAGVEHRVDDACTLEQPPTERCTSRYGPKVEPHPKRDPDRGISWIARAVPEHDVAAAVGQLRLGVAKLVTDVKPTTD